ncbi:MAG: hypothetical protein WC422_00400 [Candidatus Paceibacterota bacterium]|jgi:hypothetical protein
MSNKVLGKLLKAIEKKQKIFDEMSGEEQTKFIIELLEQLGLATKAGKLTPAGVNVFQALKMIEKSGKPYRVGADISYYQSSK